MVPLRLLTGLIPGLLSVALAQPAQDGCLQKCLQSADVPSFFREQPQFANLTNPYNLRLPFTPAAVVTAENAGHVSNAVRCASSCGGFKIQARGGGHSYASHSLGGQNGSLVIDLASINQVTVKPDTSADIGGGVRLGNLDKALYEQGRRAISHGTCADVGIGGHSTHGGYGFDSRLWGLSLDHIQSVEVVLADSTIQYASFKENSDLFWALRGAAESIGIITKFNFRTQPAPESLVFWTFDLSGILKDLATSVDAVMHLQDFALNETVQDRRSSWGWYMTQHSFLLRGKFHGPLDEFNQRIAPEILRSLPHIPSRNRTVREVHWLQSQALFHNGNDDISELSQPDQPGKSRSHENFYSKSITVPDPLTREAVTGYFDFIREEGVKVKSPASWNSIVNLYGGPDSQINIYDGSWSSLRDRDSLWVFQNYASVKLGKPFEKDLFNFLQGLDNAMTQYMPNTSFGAYSNYIDPELTAQEAHDLYYGPLYPRLLDIKKRVDPHQTFTNPLAVGVGDF